MPSPVDVIRLLADGQVHSGTELAAALGCSRTAVWKQCKPLSELGLDVAALPGKGYQLHDPVDLLDPISIQDLLRLRGQAALVQELVLEPVADSTSEMLRRAPAPDRGQMRVALAEFQHKGRGRRGRGWVSPFGSGLCLSVSWSMEPGAGGLAGLSLALGVAVQACLSGFGAHGVGLKWPNDLIVDGAKLGGLLLDLEGEADGPIKLVAGLGINVRTHPGLRAAVLSGDALPPITLDECCAGPVARNTLAAELTCALGSALVTFERDGFSPFAEAWRRADVLHGKAVRVKVGNRSWVGEARGIAPDGALLVARDGAVESVMSGDVSVRSSQ